MARIEIEVKYNAEEDIREIVSITEKMLNDMSEDKEKVRALIQEKIQTAFNEGRRFQKTHSNIEMR